MDFLRYFFRAHEDGFRMKPYGFVHITILAFFLFGIFLIASKKFNLDNENKNKKFLKILASIILVDQIILYSWQLGSGHFTIDTSLPLYHCRISAIFLIIAVFTNNKFFKTMTLFWGGIGSALAMSIPDLYKFSFPHYTNFQFYIVHILLGWVVVDFVFIENIRLNINDLKKAMIFTNIYNIFLAGVNLYLIGSYPDVNYGYLMAIPGGYTLLNNKMLHAFVMIILFNFATIALYKLFTLKYEERSLWEISKSLRRAL